MPPLIAALLVGAGLYAGYRIASHLAAQLKGPSAADGNGEGGDKIAGAEKDLGTLERDPGTGVYRPVERKD